MFCVVVFSCNNEGSNASADRAFDVPEPDILQRLIGEKEAIDELIAQNKYHIDSIPSVNDTDSSYREYESKAEPAYRIFRNSSGSPVSIEQLSASPAGDWVSSVTYYLDNSGKTFAIEMRTGIINSPCGDGTAHAKRTFYYDDHFELRGSSRKLTDGSGTNRIADSCFYSLPDEGPLYFPTAEAVLKKAGLTDKR